MFKPLHNMATVVLDPKNTTTEGGIHLPDNHADGLRKATIRAISVMASDKLADNLKTGTRVLLMEHRQQRRDGSFRVIPFEMVHDGDAEVAIVELEDILGILDEEGK